MQARYRLSPSQPDLVINLTWQPDGLAIYNYSPYIVYVRTTSGELPDESSFDFLVPAAGTLNVPVNSSNMALHLAAGTTVGSVRPQTVDVIVYRQEASPFYSQLNLPLLDVYSFAWGSISSTGGTIDWVSPVIDARGYGGLYVAMPVYEDVTGSGITPVLSTNDLSGYIGLFIDGSSDGRSWRMIDSFLVSPLHHIAAMNVPNLYGYFRFRITLNPYSYTSGGSPTTMNASGKIYYGFLREFVPYSNLVYPQLNGALIGLANNAGTILRVNGLRGVLRRIRFGYYRTPGLTSGPSLRLSFYNHNIDTGYDLPICVIDLNDATETSDYSFYQSTARSFSSSTNYEFVALRADMAYTIRGGLRITLVNPDTTPITASLYCEFGD